MFFFTNKCTVFSFTDIPYQCTIFFIDCFRGKGQMLHFKTELQTEITLKCYTQKYSLRKGSAGLTFVSSVQYFCIYFLSDFIFFRSLLKIKVIFAFSFKYHASLFCEIGLNVSTSTSPHFFLILNHQRQLPKSKGIYDTKSLKLA